MSVDILCVIKTMLYHQFFRKFLFLVILFVFLATPLYALAKKYYLRQNIKSTYFWIGQDFGNGLIAEASAFDAAWLEHFGGIDDPYHRRGYYPFGFRPKENPFYVALPYSDFDVFGRKENAKSIFWYDLKLAQDPSHSFIKNRWIKIIKNKKAAFAQVEDAGPGYQDDFDYVFGKNRPRYSFGIDVSPAVKDYLRLSDTDLLDWRFVKAKAVKAGPWKEIVTKRGISW